MVVVCTQSVVQGAYADTRRRPHQRMSADEKAQVLEKVDTSSGSKRNVMAELGVFKSTHYRRSGIIGPPSEEPQMPQ